MRISLVRELSLTILYTGSYSPNHDISPKDARLHGGVDPSQFVDGYLEQDRG
jgi:hypothetical protein